MTVKSLFIDELIYEERKSIGSDRTTKPKEASKSGIRRENSLK